MFCGEEMRLTTILWTVCTTALLVISAADLEGDRLALITLRSSLGGKTLSWNVNQSSPCKWFGVECHAKKPRVTKLRLPGASLSGKIPDGIFSNLTELQTLSLRLNSITGSPPSDLASCTQLAYVYLQGNNFFGEIPDSILGLTRLVKLNLADNKFYGPLPLRFNNLTNLKTLYLENNNLSGLIPPEIQLKTLDQFNVSNNQINGSIPTTLQKFGISAFQGTNLCGKPLPSCPLEVSHSGDKSGLSGGAIAAIVVGCFAAIPLLLLLVLLFGRTCEDEDSKSMDMMRFHEMEKHLSDAETIETTEKETADFMEAEGEKSLVFFKRASKVFDLEDLLKASAEVLGKGTIATAYKAVMQIGMTVVVKRLKEASVSQKDFRSKIEQVGAVDHANLLPLTAYYYGRDEKLLVLDFVTLGSFSSLLHRQTNGERKPLSWQIRSRIVLGAAKGIAYLHGQDNNVIICHGNVKSSNVLVSDSYEARVSDYGVINLAAPSSSNRVSGYRAPEVRDSRDVSREADVYSFGVMMMEAVTGKAPSLAVFEEGVDVPRWVKSVGRNEWLTVVVDVDLAGNADVGEEMLAMLQIGVDCTAEVPRNRPSMSEVASRIAQFCPSSCRPANP